MSDESEFFQVYCAQNGANVTAVMARRDVEKLQSAINEGRPYGIWIKSAEGRLTGLTVNPLMGGLTLSISAAQRIPLTQDGQIAQTQASLAKWLEPADQARGKLIFPEWGKAIKGDLDDALEPVREDPKPRMKPPPEPPGLNEPEASSAVS